ncbi:MAG: lipopolysaccharide transport periplasmic protein LptA [Lautropia sp.]
MKPEQTNRAGPLARTALATFAVLALLSIVPPPHARAQKADRDQPTNVEADRLEYDDGRQRTVFTGKVVLTKGSLVIRGDRLVLEQGANERQTAVATGKPASFRQKRDGTDQYLDGTAAKIEYDSASEKLVFTGGAVLTRLECGKPTDEISGALIVYDARAETFSVDGKPRTDGKAAADGGGRVRVTIQPRTEARKPADGASKPAANGGGAKSAAPCPPGTPVDLQAAPRITTPRPGATPAKP